MSPFGGAADTSRFSSQVSLVTEPRSSFSVVQGLVSARRR